jgi:hypothetical protein
MLSEILRISASYGTEVIDAMPMSMIAGAASGFARRSKELAEEKRGGGLDTPNTLTPESTENIALQESMAQGVVSEEEMRLANQLDQALDQVEREHPDIFKRIKAEIEKQMEMIKAAGDSYASGLDDEFLTSSKYNAAAIRRMLAGELVRSGKYGNLDAVNYILAASIVISGRMEKFLMDGSIAAGEAIATCNQKVTSVTDEQFWGYGKYIRCASTALSYASSYVAPAIAPLAYAGKTLGSAYKAVFKGPAQTLTVALSGFMLGAYKAASGDRQATAMMSEAYNSSMGRLGWSSPKQHMVSPLGM